MPVSGALVRSHIQSELIHGWMPKIVDGDQKRFASGPRFMFRFAWPVTIDHGDRGLPFHDVTLRLT